MTCTIDRVDDVTAVHAVECLAIWANSSTGSWLAPTGPGNFGGSSEQIGRFVAGDVPRGPASGATWTVIWSINSFVLCLGSWKSSYVVPRTSATSKATCGSSASSARRWRWTPDACRFTGSG